MNKVSLESDPASTGTPVLDFYLNFWRAKGGHDSLPSRTQVRPADLMPHLPAATVVEFLSDIDDFRFRLVGTGVAQYFLADATGKTFRQIYARADPRIAEAIIRLHRSTIERRIPMLAHVCMTLFGTTYFPAFDVLYLPLANERGEGAFVLSAYHFPKMDQTQPDRFPAPPIDASPFALSL